MNETGTVRFGGVSPYLCYEDAKAALGWLARAFGFTERVRYLDPYGVARAPEMYAGDTPIQQDGVGPGYWEGSCTPGAVMQLMVVYVEDVDAHHARVVSAGVDTPEPRDDCHGGRVYPVNDLCGHAWIFWQHLSDEIDLPDGWREVRV